MSLLKSAKVIKKSILSREDFNKNLLYLQEQYDSDFLESDDDIADLMNFEFDMLLSGEDVKRLRTEYDVDEEDSRLIYKHMGGLNI